ncbi:hypothetical protein JVU11DRAFT_2968 [Chiua virens]|nr:hypothetical protein JVU11DRAFT_2968 [Chiua virens]
MEHSPYRTAGHGGFRLLSKDYLPPFSFASFGSFHQVGSEAEALGILAYYHANGKKDALIEYEFEVIKEAIKFDREVVEKRWILPLVQDNRKQKTDAHSHCARVLWTMVWEWSAVGKLLVGWKYYLVYVFWIAFEAVFLWLYVVETKNRTLKETAALFDGEEAIAQIVEKTTAMTGLAVGDRVDGVGTSEKRGPGE